MRLSETVTLVLDVAEWMQQHKLDRVRLTDREWVTACCPFHEDRLPSFAVNVDTGRYRCLGCGASGTFVQLVQLTEGHDTLWDAEHSLILRYGSFVSLHEEPLTLVFGEAFGGSDMNEDEEVSVERLPVEARYLIEERKLAQSTIERYGAFYDPDQRAVAFPWTDTTGRIKTIKYRSTDQKSFWYRPEGTGRRVTTLLYGLSVFPHEKSLVLCEGEIDALSVYQAGYPCIATGTAQISDKQLTLLRNHPCEEVVLFCDNDKAGRAFQDVLSEELLGHKSVSVVDWSLVSLACKDANTVLCEFGQPILVDMVVHRVPVTLPLRF